MLELSLELIVVANFLNRTFDIEFLSHLIRWSTQRFKHSFGIQNFEYCLRDFTVTNFLRRFENWVYNWLTFWTPILDTPLQYTKLNIFNFVIPEKTLQYVVSNFVSKYILNSQIFSKNWLQWNLLGNIQNFIYQIECLNLCVLHPIKWLKNSMSNVLFKKLTTTINSNVCVYIISEFFGHTVQRCVHPKKYLTTVHQRQFQHRVRHQRYHKFTPFSL